jgi:hypothetical protein
MFPLFPLTDFLATLLRKAEKFSVTYFCDQLLGPNSKSKD